MKFSERYGYERPSEIIIREKITPEIQNAICSCYDDLHNEISKYDYDDNRNSYLEEYVWCYFLNQRKNDYWKGLLRGAYKPVSTSCIENSKIIWYKKLNLIELTFEYLNNKYQYTELSEFFTNALNNHFKRLNFAYRVVGNNVIEIANEEEIQSIETAIESNKDNVRLHLNNALKLFSQRPEADYRNSIKESITAVEALNRQITGEKVLNFKRMEDTGITIPSVLRMGFEKLYAYTNDSTTGIRHALMDETAEYVPGAEEALFMLVSCSAFINYLNSKKK